MSPGKQSLYQRVLTRPGSSLYARPGANQAVERELPPFSIFYVYARSDQTDGTWVLTGTDSHGTLQGWIPESNLIPWNQGLTVTFRDPIDHDRVLLFRDKDALKALVEAPDNQAYSHLYAQAAADTLPPDSSVVAIAPKAHVDILKDFYLVPIRDFEQTWMLDEPARMLQVASVPLRRTDSREPAAPAAGNRYRSGLVFVIDSTRSMGPYIERTREAVRKIHDTIEQAQLLGDVSFGLVAYRDNPEAVKGLEYLTRGYANLEQGRDPKAFLQRVESLTATRVSSRGFIEDAYAGIREALDGIDWRGHAARYIVLITDAGARTAGDPLGSTGMSAETLQLLARDKGVAISVLHLLTPSRYANHDKAASQYRTLSHYPGIGDFYYGVPMGEVDDFGQVLDSLARQITHQVRDAAQGKPPMIRAPQGDTDTATGGEQLAGLQEKVARLGYALRMRYLQEQSGTPVPDLFNAWLVDRDFRDPQRRTLDVRVLLTRDQLSDLHSVLRQVLSAAEEGLLSPRNFLEDLKSLAATVSRDPQQLGRTTRSTAAGESNLADLGFMREYLEDLPYQGEVMTLSLEDWREWPAKRQFQFVQKLEEKISYYQALHDNTDLWVSLNGGPVSGNSVFPVALEMLP